MYVVGHSLVHLHGCGQATAHAAALAEAEQANRRGLALSTSVPRLVVDDLRYFGNPLRPVV